MDHVRKFHKVLSFESTRPQFKESTAVGKIGVTGFLLGVAAGVSYCTLFFSSVYMLLISVDNTSNSHGIAIVLTQWATYTSLLASFHFLEFLLTALYQPGSASYDSFVINHSFHYTLAFLASVVEFWAETAMFGASKRKPIVIIAGLCFLIGGQVVRTLAMYTCAENFAHLIMDSKDNHQLVKTGIYSHLAHPSYVGWFYWSIGTQLLLCNPLCCVLYCYASWSFFNERIPYEERVLHNFYGEEYRQYRRGNTVAVGIPFISSPMLKEEL